MSRGRHMKSNLASAAMLGLAACLHVMPSLALDLPGRDRTLLDTHSHTRASVLPGNQAGKCQVDMVSITSFVSGGAGLTPEARGQLQALAQSLSGQGCAASIAGYASNDGSARRNEQLAAGRAASVLAYLEEIGADLSGLTATGNGPTTQFGPSLADNRRVTIQFQSP